MPFRLKFKLLKGAGMKTFLCLFMRRSANNSFMTVLGLLFP